jgi:hypothetical protein
MTERAAVAGVPFSWVAGDEVYGDNGPLRAWLEEQDIAHVLAVACNHRVPASAGRLLRADELAARLPRKAWAAAAGRGRRQTPSLLRLGLDHGPGPGHRCLLIRRNRSRFCLSPTPTTYVRAPMHSRTSCGDRGGTGNRGMTKRVRPGSSHGKAQALPGRGGPKRGGKAPRRSYLRVQDGGILSPPVQPW